jgi:hypothetical protein
MIYRAVLVLFAAVSLPITSQADDICPEPPVVEYYDAATEQQIPTEEIVGVWYVEEVIDTPTEVGTVYALFISPTDHEYEIDTSWIIYGDDAPVSIEEMEQRFRALAMN